MSSPRVVLAGGGTGGHVFPMIAVADALRQLRPDVELLFVGTRRGLETRLVPERGYPLRLVDILPMRGGGPVGALRGATRAVTATLAERKYLAELEPCVVFSIGGYAAGPVALAAYSLGIPVALLEPNSVIGLANRLMVPFVKRAYTAFPATDRYFASKVRLRTGVPLRAQFRAEPYALGAVPRILVLGGSQGAKSLNEALPEAFCRLPAALEVVHQCGALHLQAVQALYSAKQREALKVEVVPFIDDMPSALAQADLVISRSGASAVSEICAVGRPSLLLPYPYAAGDHQRMNARALVEEGAAISVDADEVTPQRLAEELGRLLEDRVRLSTMAQAALRLARPDAAEVIAKDLLALGGVVAGGSHEPETRRSRTGSVGTGPGYWGKLRQPEAF